MNTEIEIDITQKIVPVAAEGERRTHKKLKRMVLTVVVSSETKPQRIKPSWTLLTLFK